MTQQRFVVQDGVNVAKTELSSLVDSLHDLLKFFDKGSKCLQIPLPKHKIEIETTKSEDNLFAHYYEDIIEHSNRLVRLSFRFGNNNSCVFSFKKFELHGNHFKLTEIVNLNNCEFHHLYKNRYYVTNKCEIIESNYDV